MRGRSWITEGVILATATAAGYWCAFLFELGYCKYFDIPDVYVEVGVANILIAIGGIGSLLFFAFTFMEGVYGIYRVLPLPLRSPVRRLTFASLIFAGLSVVFHLKWKIVVYTYLATIGPFVLLEFIFPLVTERKIKGYLNKLQAAQAADKRYESATDVLAKTMGIKAFLAVFLICLASFVAFVAGGINARQKRVFMVPVSDPQSVVLKRNSEYYVTAKFDREKRLASRQFTVVPISKEEPFKFSHDPVGPLSPVGME